MPSETGNLYSALTAQRLGRLRMCVAKPTMRKIGSNWRDRVPIYSKASIMPNHKTQGLDNVTESNGVTVFSGCSHMIDSTGIATNTSLPH